MSFINIRGNLYDLSQPRVMGILNITPDSFFQGSRTIGRVAVLDRVRMMIDSGVDILDVGGCSTRPGADVVNLDEELNRIRPALEIIRKNFPDIIISVDTFRSAVARVAVEEYGVDIINDISGGMSDTAMFAMVASLKVPYIMMHMQGTPSDMQNNPKYDDVVSDIIKWFAERLNICRDAGINDIIIDPGFGFGKRLNHNYTILNSLDRFSILGCPILAGLSRKSMIWKVLEVTPDSESALVGTIALNTIALLGGASIIRVHDTAEAVQTIKLVQRLKTKD